MLQRNIVDAIIETGLCYWSLASSKPGCGYAGRALQFFNSSKLRLDPNYILGVAACVIHY